MKTANDYLKEIESGKPYTYSSPLNPKRQYTITYDIHNERGYFVLSCNNKKSKEILPKKEVLNIINNCLEEDYFRAFLIEY